jgi:hypothetical protein
VVSANAMMIDLLGGNAGAATEELSRDRPAGPVNTGRCCWSGGPRWSMARALPWRFFNSRTGRTSAAGLPAGAQRLGEMLGVSGSAVDITARVCAERTVRGVKHSIGPSTLSPTFRGLRTPKA